MGGELGVSNGELGVGNGELGVTILVQKCEWLTHTLRGSSTPLGGPAGPAAGPAVSKVALFVHWPAGQPVIPRGLASRVPVDRAGTQGVDRGWPGVGRGCAGDLQIRPAQMPDR